MKKKVFSLFIYIFVMKNNFFEQKRIIIESLKHLTQVDDIDSNAGDDCFDDGDSFVFDAVDYDNVDDNDDDSDIYPTDLTQSSQLSDCDPNLNKTSK